MYWGLVPPGVKRKPLPNDCIWSEVKGMFTIVIFFFSFTFHKNLFLHQCYSYDVCVNTCQAVGNLEFWTEGTLSHHQRTAAIWPNVGVMCPLVVTSGPDHSLHTLSHMVINMNDLYLENLGKECCWSFQQVFYTLHSLCKWLFYLCQFNSLSLHCLLCLMLFCFLFFSIAVWWSLHHLYTHERALLSPEPCCLHWTIWGLLRPCTAFWGVSLQQPPLPASSGLPVLYLASRKASGNIRIKDWCWLSKW